MYSAGVWQYFHNILLLKYSSQYNGINVVTGPAFDYNFDGQFDAADQIKQYVLLYVFILLCFDSCMIQDE